MMAAPLTRRALARAAGATLGAIALPAGVSTTATAATPPAAVPEAANLDAELFDLLSRRADAFADAKAAEADLDAAEDIVHAVWDAKPEGLLHQGKDSRLGIGACTGGPCTGRVSEENTARRFYLPDDVERLRAISEAYRPTSPSSQDAEARRREIITAQTVWHAKLDEARAATSYDALSSRYDEAWDTLVAIERRIADTPAQTLAGLCAKAALVVEIADRRSLEHVPVAFAHEVAAFRVPT